MNIAADHLEEITNIAISRRQREAWELPAEVRARFADHAMSVNRPDVAVEFLSINHASDPVATIAGTFQ